MTHSWWLDFDAAVDRQAAAERKALRRLAMMATFGDGDEGGWARWTDLDGTPHMQGRVMVGFSARVIPDGELWAEGAGASSPVAECYTPELANFIAAANPAAVLGLLDDADALRASLAHMTEARDNARAEVERLTGLVEAVREAARARRKTQP